MGNEKLEAKKILKRFINMSNSNGGGLVSEHDLNRFIGFVKFCLYNNVSFSEDDFLFVFKNEVDGLGTKYKKLNIKKLYGKYIEYKEVLRDLE